MSELEQNQSNKIFLSIIQGSLRQSVPEGTPNAVRRDWEAGGKSGTKYEHAYTGISGRITDVSFYEGEADGRKFVSLNVALDENADGKIPVISVGVGSRYATDILKKLPNVELAEEVKFRPYSFVPDGEDKPVTGVEVKQQDGTGQFNKKITNFFHKKEGDKWVALNGYPEPEGETSSFTSDDWAIYYKKASKFLMEYTKENISTKFEDMVPLSSKEKEEKLREKYPLSEKVEEKEEINPDDIPF